LANWKFLGKLIILEYNKILMTACHYGSANPNADSPPLKKGGEGGFKGLRFKNLPQSPFVNEGSKKS
jgi:hypothetical protein